MNGVYYNYEWDYWQVYHKVTFDGPNKLILINEGETTLDVKNDIYSSWKEWFDILAADHPDNPGYLLAMTAIGGEPTPTGQIGSTFFLQNGWKIKPWAGSYRLTINGNLYTSDGSNPFVPSDVIPNVPNNITINSTVSNIVDLVGTSGGGGGSSVTISDVPPASPEPGDLWWNSTTGILMVFYYDGTSYQWVAASPSGASDCPTVAEIVAGIDNTSNIATQINNIDNVTTSTNILVAGALGGSPSQFDDLVATVNNIDTTTLDIQTTVNNIENEILTGGFPTLGQITDAVWNAALASYTTNGSAGLIVSTILSTVVDNNTKAYEIKTVVDSLLILIDELLKYERNRTRIDKVAKTLTVYDDDGVTPIRVFNLLDGTGAPSVTEVCERDPGAAPITTHPTTFSSAFSEEFE